MEKINIYKRILEILEEDLNDPELGLDSLSRPDLETIAEIVTGEIETIVNEVKSLLKSKIVDLF